MLAHKIGNILAVNNLIGSLCYDCCKEINHHRTEERVSEIDKKKLANA